MRRKDGTKPLEGTLQIECKGVRLGIFGVMVPMVTEKMASRAASSFLWDQPIPVAVEKARELRKQVDLVIALTHIGVREDRRLAEASNDIDLILGGHSHTVLEEPEIVQGTYICQGGSHGRFAGCYQWTVGHGLTAYQLAPLA